MKMKVFIITASIFLFSTINAQKVIKLWKDKPPTSNEITEAEKTDKTGWITNVSEPTMSIYIPKQGVNRHAAIIICPGGGYAGLAARHEGSLFAQWLQKQGITGVVLKYRLPNKHKEVPLADAQQAMRYLRTNAKKLDLDQNKIGIAGFSAGGHLAATASTHFYTEKTIYSSGKCVSPCGTLSFVDSILRPSFSILFYPVISMGANTHAGSRDNLLGDNPSKSDIDFYSTELQVSQDTPPTILLLSDDDTTVSPKNSVSYYQALMNKKIPACMYIFPEGGHGWGMNSNFKYHQEMLSLVQSWLDKTLTNLDKKK